MSLASKGGDIRRGHKSGNGHPTQFRTCTHLLSFPLVIGSIASAKRVKVLRLSAKYHVHCLGNFARGKSIRTVTRKLLPSFLLYQNATIVSHGAYSAASELLVVKEASTSYHKRR